MVGGGYGGACCAAELQKSGVPFLVVDPKEFFYHNVAALRAAVYPEYSKVRRNIRYWLVNIGGPWQ